MVTADQMQSDVSALHHQRCENVKSLNQ